MLKTGLTRSELIAGGLALVAVLVVLALILNLGPFSNDDAAAPDQFVQRADQICADTQRQFADQQQTQPASPEQAAEITTNLRDLAQGELDQIKALPVPPDIQSGVDRYLASRQNAIALLQKGIDAASSNHLDAYRRYQAQVTAGQLKRQKLARAVGLRQCSQPSVDRKQLAEQSKPPAAANPNRPNQVGNPPGPP